MTMPDPMLDRSGSPGENVLGEPTPGSEGHPDGDRVYAPASERVPVTPTPGHRDVVTHIDAHTPEREAAGEREGEGSTEPAFTRVSRPSTAPSAAYTPPDDTNWNRASKSRVLPFGIGLGWLIAGAGIAAWLYLRWQRERNKPINRLRRQAKNAAVELRDRVPSSPEEAVKPAAGLTTALLSLLIILWQQSQARARLADKTVSQKTKKTAKRAAAKVSDADLEKKLGSLKKRWNPSRLELEKIAISKH